jgi:hypothetical protein
MVLEAWTDLPIGIITENDIAHAAADGKDVNSTRIRELMTTRANVIKTTTSVYDTARVMTSGHFRHLPVVGDAGLVGIVDIIDVCRALLEPAFPSWPAWASQSSARPSLSRAGDDRLRSLSYSSPPAGPHQRFRHSRRVGWRAGRLAFSLILVAEFTSRRDRIGSARRHGTTVDLQDPLTGEDAQVFGRIWSTTAGLPWLSATASSPARSRP